MRIILIIFNQTLPKQQQNRHTASERIETFDLCALFYCKGAYLREDFIISFFVGLRFPLLLHVPLLPQSKKSKNEQQTPPKETYL